jgi:hypothetical protein
MIIQDGIFQQLKAKHAKEILSYLISQDKPFSILCPTDEVSFEPQLPKEILEEFKEVILFTLANYTLKSADIQNSTLIFEAGFGEENFASVVSIDTDRIIQILENDIPLFINPCATLPKEKKENPFALNPRNKKFIKEEK